MLVRDVGIRWRIRIPLPGGAAEIKNSPGKRSIHQYKSTNIHRVFVDLLPCWRLGAWLQPDFTGKIWLLSAAVDTPIRSTIGINLPPSICTRRLDGFCHGRNHLFAVIETRPITKRAADGGTRRRPAA
ncbi:hypothetical protein F511_42030 [Dorcoceras hygrometricum]|uniref:Uncharacterized protein n=1 Tax=Dorcoceras hygrometricum TaxID=472368 RepID=A0A2Z7ACP4_9LAMI|nr:hypothetical protein F511_42030 [Dorcoceras hygrometricum]